MIKAENSRIKSVQHYLQKAKEFVLDNPINQLEHISFSIKKDKFVDISEVFDDVHKNGAGYYIIDIIFKNKETDMFIDYEDFYENNRNEYIFVKPGIQDFQSYEEDFLNVIIYKISEINKIVMENNSESQSKIRTVLENINAILNRVIDIESIPNWVILYFVESSKDMSLLNFDDDISEFDDEDNFLKFLDLSYHTALNPELKELVESFNSK